jgi:acyl carrier protein
MPATMNREEVIETARRLAAEQVSVDPASVTLDMDLFNDLGFDSLDAVEFTMNIEEAFELSIPDEQSENVRTVGQAVEMLVPLVSPAPTPL